MNLNISNMTNLFGRITLSYLVIFMLVFIPQLKAQNEKLTASASATTIATGDRYKLLIH